MCELHPACLTIAELLACCDERHERRSGPGGQHRNKVATAVVLTHRPSGLKAEANERRSQAVNRTEAARRLRLLLALQIRSPAVREEISPLWKSRVANGRLTINPAHDDFPALLAEALDIAAVAEYDIAAAARLLGVSTSQLARFLQDEPRAWTHVNEHRRQRGLRPLR